jgi:hypothetical protein
MKKITPFLLVVLNVLFISAAAQTNSEDLTGAQILRAARAIYDQGRLHELPAVLETALKNTHKNQFTQSEKVEALQILVLSYIYLEEPKKADEKMIELLKTEHFFELAESDPVEFQNLYKKFRKDPIFKMGLKLGLNQTFVNTLKNYYILGESSGKGEYTSNLALQYGLSFEKTLKGQWVMNPEIYLSNAVFNYKNASIYHNDPAVDLTERSSSVAQKITQQRLQLNLLMQYTIGKNESLNRKLTPYVVAGPAIGYLMKSTFTGQHNLESKDNITGDDIDNTDRYNPINVSLIGGVGARLKIGGIYVSADVRYQYGLLNVVNGANRYKEDTPGGQRLLRQYAYIDNDFSLSQAVFNVGFIYPVFSPKKLIK